MSFCMLFYVVSKNYSEHFFQLCGEEGKVFNSDLMPFELLL